MPGHTRAHCDRFEICMYLNIFNHVHRDVVAWITLTFRLERDWIDLDQSTDSCTCGNEPLGSIQFSDVAEWLHKKGSAPCTHFESIELDIEDGRVLEN
jgi:hypothetical protein